MSHRKRHTTECSDASTASIISTEIVQVKRESCLNKLILHLILAVSVTALVLVILVIYGRIGSKCSCLQGIFKGWVLLLSFLFNAAVHKCIRSTTDVELHWSHLLSAVLCYIFVKAGMIFLHSCTYLVAPGDYQPLFGEIKEWNFLLKMRKTAAESNTTVSVRSNSFRIYAFIHVLSRFFVSSEEEFVYVNHSQQSRNSPFAKMECSHALVFTEY